jgi:hypothetical protein
MKNKKEQSFISIFAVIFLVCCTICSIAILFMNGRSYPSEEWNVRRSLRTLELYALQENESRVNLELLNEALSQRFSFDDPITAQTVFYTGDIPAVKSEYVIKVYQGKKAYFAKINPNGEFGLYPEAFSETPEKFWEAEK